MLTASRTHIGLQRPDNQDRHLVLDLQDGRLLAAVADGMGGQAGGGTAAQMAVDHLAAAMGRAKSDHLYLAEVFRRACLHIAERGKAEPELEGMGTTLTAALVGDGRVEWAHVGDSRLHLWRRGRLLVITRDHTAAAFMVEEGMLAAEEAERHPARHMLFDCLGCGECEPDSGIFAAEPGDVLLLTSDGLHGAVAQQEIERVLARESDLGRALAGLVELALKAGGKDNITIVGLRLP